VLIGLPLVALCSAWTAFGEIRLGAELVNSSLMIPPVFMLLALSLCNIWVARHWPGRELNRRELLTVYMLLIVSVCIGGKGMMEMLLPTIAEARHYAVQKRWVDLADALPRWWQPAPSSLKGFFYGKQALNWHGWLIPFATWGGFLVMLLATTFCLSLLVRRIWVRQERLVFPITALPLELTRTDGGLLSSRTMWMGFALVMAVESLNALHFSYPSLPYVPLKAGPELDFSAAFTTPPWNALRGWTVSFYPFAIGIAFLVTAEVSFSCWFFYLLVTKLEVVACAALGLNGAGATNALARFPYISEQGAGAYMGFALLVVWSLRRLLKDHTRAEVAAAIGVLVGSAGIIGFCVAGGCRFGVAALFWAVTMAFLITLTRARAEGGTVWALGPDTAASLEVLRITGTALPVPTLMVMAVMQFFTNDWRALVMPNQLESLRMADSARVPLRRLLIPLALATLLGIVVSFWASLAVWYRYGCSTAQVDNWALTWGGVPWSFGRYWLKNPLPPDVPGLWGVGFGAASVWMLAMLRSRLLWWPLNPIGYVLGSSSDLAQVWFCFFLGWLAKSLALRYGGRRLFDRLLPFFLGLILGDFAAAGLWSLIGMVFDTPVYKVFP